MTDVDEVGVEVAIERFVIDDYYSPTDWPKYQYKKLIKALIEERKELKAQVATLQSKT